MQLFSAHTKHISSIWQQCRSRLAWRNPAKFPRDSEFFLGKRYSLSNSCLAVRRTTTDEHVDKGYRRLYVSQLTLSIEIYCLRCGISGNILAFYLFFTILMNYLLLERSFVGKWPTAIKKKNLLEYHLNSLGPLHQHTQTKGPVISLWTKWAITETRSWQRRFFWPTNS